MLTNGLKMIGNDKKDINKYKQMLTSVNNCEQKVTNVNI